MYKDWRRRFHMVWFAFLVNRHLDPLFSRSLNRTFQRSQYHVLQRFSRTCTSLSNGYVNRSHFSYPALGATASLSLLPLQIIVIALVSQTITRSRRCCEACILRYRRFTPSSGPKCETREELNIVCECLALGMLPRRSCIACNRANQHCARPSGIRYERCEEQDIEY